MKHRLALFVTLAALAGTAPAEEYRLGDLKVVDPWARELPPVAETGAAYFRVENRGEADRIVSIASSVAERAELHAHEMEEDVMKMRRLPSVEVPAGGGLAFEPGGLHVMLIGLEEPLAAGESFAMTIHFESAGALEARVHVRSFDESGHGSDSERSRHAADPLHSLDPDSPDGAFV